MTHSLLAPAAEQSNATRRLAWAVRMMTLISEHMCWEFSQISSHSWRIRLPVTHYDFLLASSDEELVSKADSYYAAYKELSYNDPERLLPVI